MKKQKSEQLKKKQLKLMQKMKNKANKFLDDKNQSGNLVEGEKVVKI